MRRTHDARTMVRAWKLHRLAAVRAVVSKAMMRHDPVMVEQVIEALSPKPGDVLVDGTVGLGGHARHLLAHIAPGGALVGLDWDAAILAEARCRLGDPESARLHLINRSFEEIPAVLGELGLRADGILLDLGLNSAQVDDPDRGISFAHDGPLDMRMDRTRGEPASAWINRAAPGEIERVLSEFGDERWARAIARIVLERRKTHPLLTTRDLAECVLTAIPPRARDKRIHPATRTFQAVRIWVNRELEILERSLRGAAEALAEGGVLAVLSYHSGEDRIVKRAFRDLAASEPYEELYRKPMVPGTEEIRNNPRARSAKLRALRRRAGSSGSDPAG